MAEEKITKKTVAKPVEAIQATPAAPVQTTVAAPAATPVTPTATAAPAAAPVRNLEKRPIIRKNSDVTTAKQAVIVFAHPSKTSFSAQMLEAAKKGLDAKGKKYTVIDLYEEKFDPVFYGMELANYSRGNIIDEKAKAHAEILKSADELIIIYPEIWASFNAMMKGWVDKVFVGNGFWYTMAPAMVPPFLYGTSTWIKRCTIFTSTDGAKAKTSAAKRQAKNGTFKGLRMRNVRYYAFANAKTANENKKAKHLKFVTKKCGRELFS